MIDYGFIFFWANIGEIFHRISMPFRKCIDELLNCSLMSFPVNIKGWLVVVVYYHFGYVMSQSVAVVWGYLWLFMSLCKGSSGSFETIMGPGTIVWSHSRPKMSYSTICWLLGCIYFTNRQQLDKYVQTIRFHYLFLGYFIFLYAFIGHSLTFHFQHFCGAVNAIYFGSFLVLVTLARPCCSHTASILCMWRQ